MIKYLNKNGNSSVVAYECHCFFINVQFKDGKVYRYSYASAGPYNVEQMKRLAKEGSGLCSYINRYVRNNYEDFY